MFFLLPRNGGVREKGGSKNLKGERFCLANCLLMVLQYVQHTHSLDHDDFFLPSAVWHSRKNSIVAAEELHIQV